MEQIKLILIGVFIGGGVVYFSLNESKESASPTVKEAVVREPIDCSEKLNEKPWKDNTFQQKEDIKIENEKVVKERDIIKTPDELYEEQEREIEESAENEVDSSVIVDSNVIPIELEQAESNTQNSLLGDSDIDIQIIPKELQEAEFMVYLDEDIIDSEDNMPLIEPDNIEEESETRDAISDELRDLEEYGDIDGISNENEIPK